ncbi:T9SS C-terminal target domain-containing protein, partial [Aquimarina pacifica]|uniref:T9SS C-terminal target domain-containing protein n=1 Tax=Aquimarina pacifica TaxID=1296415 RepID=UPI000554E9B8
ATDDSGEIPVITQSPAAGSAFTPGMQITMTATDGSGNITDCSFIIEQFATYVDAGEDIEIQEGEEVQLMAYTVPSSGTFSWSPVTGLSDPLIADPIASPTETTSYEVIYTNDQGCIEEDIVTVYVEALPEDTTAYGFSPNGDGIREFWEIDGIEEFPNNKVTIYNRWGDLVFQVDGYNNSSRVFSGIANRKRSAGADKLPEGTYFYTIQVQGTTSFRKPTGFLVIKR